MIEKGATSKMGKRKGALVYVLTVIIFLLIIPEIILRVCTSEQLGRISDFTSLGGLLILAYLPGTGVNHTGRYCYRTG